MVEEAAMATAVKKAISLSLDRYWIDFGVGFNADDRFRVKQLKMDNTQAEREGEILNAKQL